MINSAIEQLTEYLRSFPATIVKLSPTELDYRRNADAWSKKEIVGHLIDSATVNLTRFVVGQSEENPTIKYDQNAWCKNNYYAEADIKQLLNHWLSTNTQLLFIWQQLTQAVLNRKVNDQTLAFLADDYVVHLTHHLQQIITPYEN